jgi:hypothetical protein
MTVNRPFDNPFDRPVSEDLPQEFLDRFEARGVNEPGGPTLGAPLYEDLSDPGPYPDGEPSASLRSPGEGRGRVRERLANSAGPLALGGFDRIGGKIRRRRPPLPNSTGPDNDGTLTGYHDEQQGEQQ